MKKVINYFLRYIGLELRPVLQKKHEKFRLPIEEKKELESILKHFASQPNRSESLADDKNLRKYLSAKRLQFFYEVVELCHNFNVSFMDKKVSDIGSGTGYLLRLIQKEEPTAELHGYDTFEEMNLLGALLCPTAKFYGQSIYDINDKFDHLFCTEVLEHLTQPTKALKKMAGMMNDGGKMVLTVPNGRLDQHEAYGMRSDGNSYWGHIHFWSPESWRLFLVQTLGDDVQIENGLMRTGENYALISF
jgi:2-polyprenyl-3-methyl-5-hydroxy-6-metoxy-1,4-benzoquinol methylase